MNWHTRKFLRLCKAAGYTTIGINRCDMIEENYDFYPGPYVCGNTIKSKDVWPPIWDCLERMGKDIYGSCGNGHSHDAQLRNPLETGIYNLSELKF